MPGNGHLANAKSAKKNEFYTQYADIQNEVNAYLDYDPDVFRGKIVLLPCDDPEWSNFTKFFAQNFEKFGLKKLISTSYAIESKPVQLELFPSLVEQNSQFYDKNKTNKHGKLFILDHDTNQNGKIDINDIEMIQYLEKDGDFRSEEVTKLRDEADVIITNPPFTLFREFMAWIMEAKKKFLVIGNQNAITYKEIFPYIMNNEIWLGKGFKGGAAHFISNYQDTAVAGDHQKGMIRVSGVVWFTNLDHGRRHTPLQLMSMADNIKYSKHKEIRNIGYFKYDNYDAIEVPYTDAIPGDYDGVMGVPISFLDKFCPEQFEIVGISKTWFNFANKIYPEQIQYSANGKQKKVTKLNDGPVIQLDSVGNLDTYYVVNDKYYMQTYARIFIKRNIRRIGLVSLSILLIFG